MPTALITEPHKHEWWGYHVRYPKVDASGSRLPGGEAIGTTMVYCKLCWKYKKRIKDAFAKYLSSMLESPVDRYKVTTEIAEWLQLS